MSTVTTWCLCFVVFQPLSPTLKSLGRMCQCAPMRSCVKVVKCCECLRLSVTTQSTDHHPKSKRLKVSSATFSDLCTSCMNAPRWLGPSAFQVLTSGSRAVLGVRVPMAMPFPYLVCGICFVILATLVIIAHGPLLGCVMCQSAHVSSCTSRMVCLACRGWSGQSCPHLMWHGSIWVVLWL